MRPPLVTEAGPDARRIAPPRDALDASRQVALAAEVSRLLRRRRDIGRLVQLPAYQRHHTARVACLLADQERRDAERARQMGGAA